MYSEFISLRLIWYQGIEFTYPFRTSINWGVCVQCAHNNLYAFEVKKKNFFQFIDIMSWSCDFNLIAQCWQKRNVLVLKGTLKSIIENWTFFFIFTSFRWNWAGKKNVFYDNFSINFKWLDLNQGVFMLQTEQKAIRKIVLINSNLTAKNYSLDRSKFWRK